MIIYKEYATDLWEYLRDMPYMPSRQDRDQLLQLGDEKRVQIWDYFFRIKPEDVGTPQKAEITEINNTITREVANYRQGQDAITQSINAQKRSLLRKRVKSFLYGVGGIFLACVIYYASVNYGLGGYFSALCATPIVVYGLAMWISIGFTGWDEKREIRDLQNRSQFLKDNHSQSIKEKFARKNFLKAEVRALKQQIPTPPSGNLVREWLNEYLLALVEKAKSATGLGNRLVDIKSPNPIPVFGPGELQHPDRFPPNFQDFNSDLRKHLIARRAFQLQDQRIDVLYGIYYLEYILIADNMLATYGLFYDFITGKTHGVETTEQYYKDVVAIVVTSEFRWIEQNENDIKSLYVEDAPTFTLSLASGEHRTVTFVNEKYFMEIKDKINVAEDNISQIYLIQDSQTYAENAIKALRYQLRLHKAIREQ
jgi:hypothetical protein